MLGRIPEDKESSTSKVMSKLYESVVCPLTRRGKEVYKYTCYGAIVGSVTFAPLTLGLAEGGVGLKYLRVRNFATCNYEENNAALFNCTFEKPTDSSYCRNTGLPGTPSDAIYPLTCLNDTDNTRRLQLVIDASNYGDGIGNDWYHVKAKEVLIWTPLLGIGVGAIAGGLYGLFKSLPPEEKQQDELDQPLVDYQQVKRQQNN